MDCAAPDETTSTVTLQIEAYEATTPIPDPLGFLPALHARECLAVRLGQVATIEIASFTPAPAGGLGSLHLALAPPGTGAALMPGRDLTTPLMHVSCSTRLPFITRTSPP